MKKLILYIYLALAMASLFACIKNGDEVIKKQGPYIGSELPGIEPELFAPGIVANGYQTRDVAITPDGKEIYFGIRSAGHYSILVTKQVEEGWSVPAVLEHMEDPRYMNIEPALNFDGSKLFFLSNRPDSTLGVEEGEQDIWVMDREDERWGKPYNLGAPVNTKMPEFYPSLTKDGTLYFTRNELNSTIAYIYRSRLVNGKYTEPEKLPEQVNCGLNHYNAFIAQDESYIIVPTVGRDDSFGDTDYYIVFRDENDRWSNPINMGDKVNTPDTFEYSAYVTRDGKILFFMSRRMIEEPEKLTYEFLLENHNKPESGNPSIYWMDAGFIDTLRSTAVFG
jgi:hypothetical protein